MFTVSPRKLQPVLSVKGPQVHEIHGAFCNGPLRGRSIATSHQQGWRDSQTVGPSHVTLETDFQTRLADLTSEANALDSIAFKLPKANALAGRVVKHAVNIMEGLFSKHEPMIWKIGFTHNPSWRWTNALYGYRHAVDKWTNMIALYASPEPYSPAMLEATLIEKYGSCTCAAFGLLSLSLSTSCQPKTKNKSYFKEAL